MTALEHKQRMLDHLAKTIQAGPLGEIPFARPVPFEPGETVGAGSYPPARVDHRIPEYATPWRFIEGVNRGSQVCVLLDAGGRTMFHIRNAVVAAEIVAWRNRTYGSKRR